MSQPEPDALAIFEEFAHELGNPLMIVTGHAHLAYRRVERLPGLPDGERQTLLDGLSEIARMVTAVATQIERHHAALEAEIDAQSLVADDADQRRRESALQSP